MINLLQVLFLILFTEMLFSQTSDPPNIISQQPIVLPLLYGYSPDAIGLPFYVKNIGGTGEINVTITAWNDTNNTYTESKQFLVQSNTSYILKPLVPITKLYSSSLGPSLFLSASFPGTPGFTKTLELTSSPSNPMSPFTDYYYYVPKDKPNSTLESVTAVEENLTHIPDCFILEQNYPNPFNPITNISFSIPSKSFVSLNIFDLIGRKVATLVAQEISAGFHALQWNASNFSSGVYFYRMQAGAFIETKRLVLLK